METGDGSFVVIIAPRPDSKCDTLDEAFRQYEKKIENFLMRSL